MKKFFLLACTLLIYNFSFSQIIPNWAVCDIKVNDSKTIIQCNNEWVKFNLYSEGNIVIDGISYSFDKIIYIA